MLGAENPQSPPRDTRQHLRDPNSSGFSSDVMNNNGQNTFASWGFEVHQPLSSESQGDIPVDFAFLSGKDVKAIGSPIAIKSEGLSSSHPSEFSTSELYSQSFLTNHTTRSFLQLQPHDSTVSSFFDTQTSPPMITSPDSHTTSIATDTRSFPTLPKPLATEHTYSSTAQAINNSISSFELLNHSDSSSSIAFGTTPSIQSPTNNVATSRPAVALLEYTSSSPSSLGKRLCFPYLPRAASPIIVPVPPPPSSGEGTMVAGKKRQSPSSQPLPESHCLTPSITIGLHTVAEAPHQSCMMTIQTQAISKRDSLPLGLRNKKMMPTDCLLFAATLLEEDGTVPVQSTDDSTAECYKSSPENDKIESNPDSDPASLPNQTPSLAAAAAAPEKFGLPTSSTQTKHPMQPAQHPLSSVVPTLPAKTIDGDAGIPITSKNLQHTTLEEIVTEPNLADVLCGRGGKVNKHPGNVIFRRVVAFNKAFYQSVHKRNRILVSQSIVQAIMNYGGRFLNEGQKGKTWLPIDFKRAVQKTSQALREFKKEDEDRSDQEKKAQQNFECS